jgi:hypothetical protein
VHSTARAFFAVIALAAAGLATACGSASAGGAGSAAAVTRPLHRAATASIPVATTRSGARAVTVRLGGGRAVRSLRLREPAGAIRRYRLSAPRGSRVVGSMQLPGITVPLRIGTAPTRFARCRTAADRIVCAVAEEACPMPAGVWRLRLRKLAGPPARVTLWFRVAT